ncbi:MAG: AbrB/MazE/SpoVT family DNA-binding domain-containing protein [Candidatus Woesearchaeota archaeon]
MVEVKTKVGPKGQVVIPKVFRDEYKIAPGSMVTFIEKEGELIVKKEEKINAAHAFEQIAKSIGKKSVKINTHAIEEYEERARRAGIKL